jgi:hypothetical protein
MWYDDNPKVPLINKIEAAIDAYTRRFAISPNVVLVNASDLIDYQSVRIRSVEHIQRNNFWVGLEAAEV